MRLSRSYEAPRGAVNVLQGVLRPYTQCDEAEYKQNRGATLACWPPCCCRAAALAADARSAVEAFVARLAGAAVAESHDRADVHPLSPRWPPPAVHGRAARVDQDAAAAAGGAGDGGPPGDAASVGDQVWIRRLTGASPRSRRAPARPHAPRHAVSPHRRRRAGRVARARRPGRRESRDPRGRARADRDRRPAGRARQRRRSGSTPIGASSASSGARGCPKARGWWT